MKRKILLLLAILFLPFKVLAYSSYVYTGGKTIGIQIEPKGLMVIGFYRINGKFNKGSNEIKIGDYITKANDKNIASLKELISEIEKNIDSKEITLEVERQNKKYKTKLDLIYSDGKYKTGLYVKDKVTGIGTISYIDPETKVFGALGHGVIDSKSNSLVEIKTGKIFENYITNIDKSKIGYAGSKNATFDFNNIYGNILANTEYGIYGLYTGNLSNLIPIKVSTPKVGKAYLKTALEGQKEENFEIEIISINENSDMKNITFKITDERLINMAGGIVQGMSGSPIIQDDSIVGSVTHVIVDNPLNGYGLLITKMLNIGDNILVN